MKTTKFSLNKKIMASASMLLVSAFMLSSATYAWFTMNTEVTVTGMELKTKVGSNLLVCDTNVEANFSDDLVQARQALLEPVSSINAADGSFYYTVNAAADGHWMEAANSMNLYAEATDTNDTATAIGKSYYDATFNSTYGITPDDDTQFDTAYGYVDYVFYLKATGDAASTPINMTECNLLYNHNLPGSGDYAWRVAVFAKEISNGGTGNTTEVITSNATNLVSVLDIDSLSTNWTADKAIADGTATRGNVVKPGQAVTFGSVGAGETKYYKVVARVWLEGEDQSCNSATYAALSDNSWQLGLQFELGQGSAVTGIVSAADNDTAGIIGITPTPTPGT